MFTSKKTQDADTLEKVRTIISEQLGTDLGIRGRAKFVDLGADSLDTVEIMMALEERFEITLDEGVPGIATVQEAWDMVGIRWPTSPAPRPSPGGTHAGSAIR